MAETDHDIMPASLGTSLNKILFVDTTQFRHLINTNQICSMLFILKLLGIPEGSAFH